MIVRAIGICRVIVGVGCIAGWGSIATANDAIGECTKAVHDTNVVCIDARGPKEPPTPIRMVHRSATISPEDGILRPNRITLIRVVTRCTEIDRVDVTLGGTAGYTAPTIYGIQNALIANPENTLDECSKPDGYQLYTAQFAPRTPGAAPLVIEVFDTVPKDAPSKSRKFSIELLVPKLYAGAVRVGLGTVFGASDHAYIARMAPGTNSTSVVETSHRPLTAELIVGYVPYWEAFTKERGRISVTPPPWYSSQRLSPYIGLGIASASPASTGGTKVAWLRSFYFGAEWEFADGMSLAASLVVRRADELATGLVVGGPIATGATLTESRFELGGALIFNFSPDFFKFAASLGGK